MNFPISGRMGRMILSATLMWAVSGEAIAATLPPTFEPVQALPLGPNDSRSKLCQLNGLFYGLSISGGSHDQGMLYKVETDGTVTTLVNFDGGNGASPVGDLTAGYNSLVGVTRSGGTAGLGTVVQYQPNLQINPLHTLNFTEDIGRPVGGLTYYPSDGCFYGLSMRNGVEATIYRLAPFESLTRVASFGSVTPVGRLTVGLDGGLYGVCQDGGTSGKGFVFRYDFVSATVNQLASFDGTNGQLPGAAMIRDSDGSFIGTTRQGGASGQGTVFRVTPAGVLTPLAGFDGTNGSQPASELLKGDDGNYYGTAFSGGSSPTKAGTVFRLTPGGALTALASFDVINGGYPACGLTVGLDGRFYGVTSSGGRPAGGSNSLNGTFFAINTQGTLSVLATFSDPYGKTPLGGLCLAPDGNFYGSASEGGGSNYGAFFRMTPQGALSLVKSCDATTGFYPKAQPTQGMGANAGMLYATTTYGGPIAGGQSNGTVLKINPADNAVTLEQKLNVGFPVSVGAQTVGPVVNRDAITYGMTSVGGSDGLGTFFRTSGGTITTVANFSSSTGNTPLGGPIYSGVGSIFFGSTSAGGTGGKGTIFRIDGNIGVVTTVVNFTGTNGSTPVGELLHPGSSLGGFYYGVTRTGGTADKGTVFKTTSGGVLTTLASFTGANGSTPQAGLVMGADGNFYGTTEKGGAYDLGTIYRITQEGVLTTVFSFDGTNGSYPSCRLISGPGGYFYGTTRTGGLSPDGKSGGGGQIFRIRVYPEVVTGAASSITFNSAVLRGTAVPIEQGATVSFDYGTDPTLATSASAAANLGGSTGNDLGGTVSGLAPFTTYYYRAVTTLADGTTKVRGDIQSFTTLVAPPDIAVDAGGQTDLAWGASLQVLPNTATGQSRDFEITIRTSAITSTLSGLSASIPEQSGSFSILQQPATSVAYGSTTTLVVRFTPVVTGGATATIVIASDDADENPFVLHLRAWGGTTFSPVIDPANPDPVEWDGFTATGITLAGTLTAPPHRGTEYVILDNPGAAAVEGSFNGLPEGSLVTLTYGGNNYRFLLSYEGGDGNDIVLSYWPETGIDPEDSPEAFLFAALDSNRDDKLTPFEWQSIYVKIPKKEAIFTVIDTDHDGFLSFAEFTAGATNRTASRTISTAVNRTAVFLEVDTSVDNVVSRTEIAFMWKPGTAAKTIDSYWTRAKGGDGMDFWDWLWASSLPSFTTYDQASTLRAQRLAIAGQLDTDTSGTITFAEFSHLYKAGTKTATIDTAWRAANATPRGTASPADMTLNAFVEAAKLPKLAVF